MSKYQLWSRDEYGQGSIIFTSDDIDEVVKKGKEEVTDLNVNNALTADDRERNWEAYFVDISSSTKGTKYVYGGPNHHDTKTIYAIGGKVTAVVSLENVPEAEVKIYLGNISTSRKVEKDWWGTDVARKRPIVSLDHQDLDGKTMFFVKKI